MLLFRSDFYPYFRTTAEAVSKFTNDCDALSKRKIKHQAFALFDKDDNGDITKVEMREAVQRVYRERKALTAGLKVR
jgi:Ca2+-binding EF-hand superfamily protein